MSLVVEKIRKDFPFLEKRLVYLDSACMSLKPRQVIARMLEYYEQFPGCAGRSSHRISAQVDDAVQDARRTVQKFCNAKKESEIIFTRNTTEGINLIAKSLSLAAGDEVIISDKEHNSNLLPWLALRQHGIKICVAASMLDGTLDMEQLQTLYSKRTKIVAVHLTSNIDGVSRHLKDIARMTHDHHAQIVVDAAQAAPHNEVDVQGLDVDYMAFSGHKMLGPTGTGVLYGKKDLLEDLGSFLRGGGTVTDTTLERSMPEALPMRLEAGLQDYAGIIGLGEACRYLQKIGLDNIARHETMLNSLASEGLQGKVQLIGPQDPLQRAGVFSFNIKGLDSHAVAKMLDASESILIRSGMHCVHSWFNKCKIPGSARASFYLYNTKEETERFVRAVSRIAAM